MQSLIEPLHVNALGNLSFTLGLVLIATLLLHLALEIGRSVRRFSFDRRQQRPALEKLPPQVRHPHHPCRETEPARLVLNGWRKFVVAKKAPECDDVCAFYLKPHDGKSLPPFKPGQYLTFQLDIPGRDKPLVRCYSLSDGPRTEYYRVTIKKEKAPADRPDLPPGAASSYFTDLVTEGTILNVKAPTGHFFLDLGRTTPI